jgi:carotenoid cleavage dioxygenase-like enzyme
MWDAKNLEETPFLTADLKERVPYGFHSVFVPENKLEE